jgi:hypothetical protein
MAMMPSERIGCLVVMIVAGLLLLDRVILTPDDSSSAGAERSQLFGGRNVVPQPEPRPTPPPTPPPTAAARNRTAIVFKTMAPVSKKAVDRVMQLKKDLADTPGYDFVVMADTTKLGTKGSSPAEREPIAGLDDEVIRVWFDEPIIKKAYPEVHDLWYTYEWKDREGKNHSGYECCKHPMLWQFQNVIINYWLGRDWPDSVHPYDKVWMMQDDIGAFHDGLHVEMDEIKRVDRDQTEDLVGFNFVHMCPQNGCPGWGGARASTPAFLDVMKRMQGAASYACYSDGLQRLSRAMLQAYDKAIHDYKWRFAEGMVQPIAWDAGLKWWTYAPAGGKGTSMMPPCRRMTEQAAADRSKGGWLWAHLEDQQSRR